MKRFTKVVLVIFTMAIACAMVLRIAVWNGEQPVSVVHWSNGHLLRHGALMPAMATRFNKSGHRTKSGTRIEVEVVYYGSWEQAQDLLSRTTRGVPLSPERDDPVIVTPSAAHWLVPVNHAAGHSVVDLAAARSIVRPLIGIVTYREMAECLGWPEQEIGYTDIIALRNDPRGWSAYPDAKAEWGQRPLVAYTDPTTSSTGRSVLFTLYALAAGKTPEQLEVADVYDSNCIDSVKQFQSLVDHYMISTRVLNTKVHQGPRYGHFFLMPEDNLIELYEGASILKDGEKVDAPPIERPLVMIYPKEGSMARNNLAGIVQAPWVTDEQVEAAHKWVDFLLEDEQQRAFMAAGLRPATNLTLAEPFSAKYGLDPTPATVIYNPALIDPEVAAAIDKSWEDVKRPGIVTFVVDKSGSMRGVKLQNARDGLVRAIDSMAKTNQVGLITFDHNIKKRVPMAPLAKNRFTVVRAAQQMRASGETALYDAVKAGIEMTDDAPGSSDAIRGVVVLTDGQANEGSTYLHDIVKSITEDEVRVERFMGYSSTKFVVEDRKQRSGFVIGTGLAMKTHYPIQIFYIGIGADADMNIGRIFAEATGAEFQASTKEDLANVLEEFSKYF